MVETLGETHERQLTARRRLWNSTVKQRLKSRVDLLVTLPCSMRMREPSVTSLVYTGEDGRGGGGGRKELLHSFFVPLCNNVIAYASFVFFMSLKNVVNLNWITWLCSLHHMRCIQMGFAWLNFLAIIIISEFSILRQGETTNRRRFSIHVRSSSSQQ